MLRFSPIDVDAHGEEAFRFRADSFAASFGSAERFFAEWGPRSERYLEHLRRRLKESAGSCVHAWQDQRLVGQIELREGRQDRPEGHVNLYYLVADARGTGIAPELDRYAIEWFSGRGLSRASLAVSPTNNRAVRFCLKQGWVEAGQDRRTSDSRLMRKTW